MDWTSIRSLAAQYFADNRLVRGLGPSDILNLSADSSALYTGPIDWTWGATDKEIANRVASVKSVYQAHCNQVEALLQEAGMLLDRSLSDLTKYDDLNVERFKVLMEFLEYDKTVVQRNIEQNDDEYWNGLSNEANYSAQARSVSSSRSTEMSNQYNDAASAYDRYFRETKDNSNYNAERWTVTGSRDSTTMGFIQYEIQLGADALDSQSHAARCNYELAARRHQIERNAITDSIVAAKLSQFMTPGGAINYNQRMLAISTRAYTDFFAAAARLYAIAIGLEEFYALDSPSEAELESDLFTSRTLIEGAVTWLRKAANAITAAKLNEQETIVRVTIEPQANAQLFDELNAGRNFDFTSAMLPGTDRVHLRGVSASAECLSGDAWIDLQVDSPEQQLVHANLTLPIVVCRLGRVSSSASLNIRDVAGGWPLVNRSPVGTWSVRATRGFHYNSVTLLHVDFHLITTPG